MSESLYVKYRPQHLDDVTGQDEVVKVLKGLVERNDTHAMLFTGPSGVGKTTLARIVALDLGCVEENGGIMEIDGATYTGIDKMRSVQDGTQYQPFGKANHRCVILDECHRLSGQAWDSLLKVVEEPHSHMSWMFCTTCKNFQKYG